MPLFRPSSAPSPGQRLFDKMAVIAAAAGCCALGLWEAHSCAGLTYGSQAGYRYIAALLVAIGTSLSGLLLCIYWRVRMLGISLVISGLLSYGVFLGGLAYLTARDEVVWRHTPALQSLGPDQKAALVIYFKKGTTDEQIEDFHTTVLEQPGQPMHPEPEYPWFVINYLRLTPAQANGFDAVAVTFRGNAIRSDTDPYTAKIESDKRVEKVYQNISPLAIHIDLNTH